MSQSYKGLKKLELISARPSNMVKKKICGCSFLFDPVYIWHLFQESRFLFFFFFSVFFFFGGPFNNSAAAAVVKEIFLAYHNKC